MEKRLRPKFLTQQVTTLGKVKFTIFLTICGNFSNFLKNHTPIYEYLVSMRKTGCGKLACRNGYAKFFHTKVYDLRKSQIYDFSNVFFLNVLTFLENYPLKSDVSVPMSRTGYAAKSICFPQKLKALGKNKFNFFFTVF